MTYLATTLYLNKLYQEQYPKMAFADTNEVPFIDRVGAGIGEYLGGIVKDIKEKPLEGIVSFMAPALLTTLGFPWIAVAVEVAGALGFDWTGFWSTIKRSVLDIIKGIVSSGTKPNAEEVHEKVSAATNEALDQNVHDNINEQELQKISDKHQGMQSAASFSNDSMIKTAGLLGSAARSRGLLATVFKKIIPWVVTRALIALGFAVGGGALRGAVGIKSGPKEENAGNESETTNTPKTRSPIYNLQISPTANPDLFEVNKNDAGSVWLENGNINNIKSILSEWIFSAYPDQIKNKDKIINSSSFIEVENMFRERNKLATGLQIYSVPKPFQRKIDVVSFIMNGYLKAQGN